MPSIVMSRELQTMFKETLERVQSSKGVSAADKSMLNRLLIGIRRAKYGKKRD